MTITYGTTRARIIAGPREQAATVRICLQSDACLSLPGTRLGVRIECHAGRLWVTQPGDAADYLLTTGQTLKARSRGQIVVQALDDAVLSLTGD